MTIHAWHDIKSGKNAPEIVNSIIEIPKNSRAKYELDKETGLLCLDRVLYSPVHYPTNYGFIPQTYCDDEDPLDILVLSQIEIVPMCLLEAKVIGVMRMIDGGEMDDKILAVAKNDMQVNHINCITEMPEHPLKEIRNFFEDYKKLENKTVSIEDFQPKSIALQVVEKSIEDYQKKFQS